MQVYAEYALAENFCMDFTLLFCAKAATKNPCRYRRLALASALGACFAVAYPLFGPGGVWGIVVKLVSGAAMCALAGRYAGFRGYLKFTAVFAAATFLLGGALVALFSLTGTAYGEGGGVLLSSVPVGIPMFGALVLAIAAKKIFAKISSARAKGSFTCTLYKGGRSATCAGFYDSGNKVYYGGSPVSVIPRAIAEKIVDCGSIKNFVDIHTVAGKAKIAVFTADKVEMDDGKEKTVRLNVLCGVSPQRIGKAVIHPDLSEVN